MSMWTRQASASIIGLVVQHISLVLLIRYSKESSNKEGTGTGTYLISWAVLLSEFIKVLLNAAILACCQHCDDHDLRGKDNNKCSVWRDIFRYQPYAMAVPAVLYLIQNNLLFLAIQNLPVPIFQVLTQGKHLCTALCTRWVLQRRFSPSQCTAVWILSVGLALAHLSPTLTKQDKDTKAAEATDYTHSVYAGTRWVGILAVIISCGTSGFAGVYFERVLKGGNNNNDDDCCCNNNNKPHGLSIYIINIQLALWSMLLGSVSLFKDWSSIQRHGFFQGFHATVWAVIVCQALSGLVVSYVIKHADAMWKGLAVSMADIGAILLSILFWDDGQWMRRQMDWQFWTGVLLVFGSVIMYSTCHRVRCSLLPYRS